MEKELKKESFNLDLDLDTDDAWNFERDDIENDLVPEEDTFVNEKETSLLVENLKYELETQFAELESAKKREDYLWMSEIGENIAKLSYTIYFLEINRR